MSEDGMTVGETARMALRLIESHILDCTQARMDTKAAIKQTSDGIGAAKSELAENIRELRSWVIGCVIAVFGVLATFAGYEYVANQNAEAARLALLQSVHQSAQQTQDLVRQTAASPPHE